MSYAVDTGTALKTLSDVQFHDWSPKSSEDVWRNWTQVFLQQKGEKADVRIKEYTPNLPFPNSWLPLVEARIRASIMPGAEFESPAGHMTSVVSKGETTLFAVRTDNRDTPLQHVICRGSNHYRDELLSFIKKLTAGCHGKMVAAE